MTTLSSLENQEWTSRSVQQTMDIAEEIAMAMRPGQAVALYGDLGSGKTTFVRGFLKGCGFKNVNDVKSPTFVIMHIYRAKWPVYHFDLYRMNAPEELDAVGFEEFLSDPDAISCIEWAEKAGERMPRDAVHVTLSHVNPKTRKISLKWKR